ncbi:MAG: dihydrofolate reductase [Bacteroidales bacterium]|nr:dihydrofolate reductase [Bacteroidales bacterium]
MKPTISIIAAVAKNRAIGKGGDLIWHLSNDLKHFKEITTGGCVLMGYNTYASLPGRKALPKRRNIIISSHLKNIPEGFEVANSILDAMKLVFNEENVFVIGGGMIYEQFLPMADKLYLTRIDKAFEADTFFPIVNFDEWELTELQVIDNDPQIDCEYRFETWERK